MKTYLQVSGLMTNKPDLRHDMSLFCRKKSGWTYHCMQQRRFLVPTVSCIEFFVFWIKHSIEYLYTTFQNGSLSSIIILNSFVFLFLFQLRPTIFVRHTFLAKHENIRKVKIDSNPTFWRRLWFFLFCAQLSKTGNTKIHKVGVIEFWARDRFLGFSFFSFSFGPRLAFAHTHT